MLIFVLPCPLPSVSANPVPKKRIRRSNSSSKAVDDDHLGPEDVLVATQKTRGQSLASIKARFSTQKTPGNPATKNRLIGPNRWELFGEILFKKRCLGKQGNQKRVGGQRSQISLWIKFVEQFRLISKDVFTFRLTCDA